MGEPVFAFGLVFHLISHPYVGVVVRNFCFASENHPDSGLGLGLMVQILRVQTHESDPVGVGVSYLFQEWLSGAEPNKTHVIV